MFFRVVSWTVSLRVIIRTSWVFGSGKAIASVARLRYIIVTGAINEVVVGSSLVSECPRRIKAFDSFLQKTFQIKGGLINQPLTNGPGLSFSEC